MDRLNHIFLQHRCQFFVIFSPCRQARPTAGICISAWRFCSLIWHVNCFKPKLGSTGSQAQPKRAQATSTLRQGPEAQHDLTKEQYMNHLANVPGHITKKCPSCLTNIPCESNRCPSCNMKVGGVDKIGFAERPVDWMSYVKSILWFQGFCAFVWWAFIK